MSHYEFKRIFDKVAQVIARANLENNKSARATAITKFAGETKQWAASAGPVISIAIEICKDASFKQRFIAVMKEIQASEEIIVPTVLDLLAEVKRLDEPAAMLNQMEKRVEDTYNAAQLAERALGQAREAWAAATRELDEYKQKLVDDKEREKAAKLAEIEAQEKAIQAQLSALEERKKAL
jgi:hypothetical protein